MSDIYIIEGPDACGKTSLVGSSIFMGMAKYHQGPYDGDPVAQTVQMIKDRCNLSKEWVSDRLHYGELIYGPIIRNQDRLGRAGMRFIDRVLRGQDVVVITCLPPLDVALTNFLETKELQLPRIEQFERIYNAYAARAHGPSDDIPHAWYDYTKQTEWDLLSDISNHVSMGRTHERHLGSGVGIGAFKRGNILAIYDDMSVPTDSTLHLNAYLETVGADESAVFWCTPEAVYSSMKSLVELEPRVVVTLEGPGMKAVRNALLPTLRGSGKEAPIVVALENELDMAWAIKNYALRRIQP